MPTGRSGRRTDGTGRARPGSDEALRMRRTAALLARLNALLALGLVYVAVRLRRAGPEEAAP